MIEDRTEPFTREEAEQVFCKAAEIVETPGAWTQGKYYRGGDSLKEATCFCAVGACARAAVALGLADGDPGMLFYGLNKIATALAGVTSESELVAFNDADGRTAKQVAERLREIARKQ